VVIDDFGTGYFSLSHLRQFPVDALKIAGEFVQVNEGDSRSAALAGAIVALGQSLDITTVAEGIETRAQAERMRSLGCKFGQGYFFAQPFGEADLADGIAGLVASTGRSEASSEAAAAAPRPRRRPRSSRRRTTGLEPAQA
jgi:EAL domain-containing protein (putative c-di-GMP-specific phosphodiesterase class I)